MDRTNIIGREAELRYLEQIYRASEPSFVALYGRRRVGKTYLINEFFRNKGVFFELTGSKGASKSTQLRNFHREFLNQFVQTRETLPPENWDGAFHQLHTELQTIDDKQKVILFLDELPWLASPRSGFLPALEYIWNRHFSRRKNLILIICGSAASWMIKNVVNNEAGLYGRLSRTFSLAPFTLSEVETFLLKKNIQLPRKQLVELFMVTGGIGAYLNHIAPGKSVPHIINELCFQPSAPLFLEFNNLFRSLFDKPEKHLSIVRTLAHKRYGLVQSALLKQAQLPTGGGSSEILEELVASGFITALPMFGKGKKERKFRLIDEYSYFYLSWIEQLSHTIQQNSEAGHWQKNFNSAAWLSWAGYTFETICLKHIQKIKHALGIAAVSSLEAHWQYSSNKHSDENGAEIDLLIDRADGCIHICEIKFSNSEFVITKAYAEILRHKRELFRTKTKTQKAIFITMITPYGTTENQYYQELVQNQLTIDDLF